MRELPEKFDGKGQVRGFSFTQIKKSEYAYVYRVDLGNSHHYEVFFRKENTQYDCVSYPRDKAFGVWAWTCSENSYIDKFNELNTRGELKTMRSNG